MLTNWPTLEKRIRRLKALNHATNDNDTLNSSKKELSAQKKEQNKLSNLFSGIQNMNTLPDVAIFASQLKDHLAIQECIKLGITCLAISDTNCDPNLVPYPIPGNDDSFISVDFILKNLAHAINLGSAPYKM
jgi:small subunit ribosomal protein S2